MSRSNTEINTKESTQTQESVKEVDNFIEHLHSIISSGDYESSGSEDEFKSDNKNYDEIDEDGHMQSIIDLLQSGKDSTVKKNKTFSNEKLRDIDRTNNILMRKIVSNNRRRSQYAPTVSKTLPQNSAAINRRRQQRVIDQENMVN